MASVEIRDFDSPELLLDNAASALRDSWVSHRGRWFIPFEDLNLPEQNMWRERVRSVLHVVFASSEDVPEITQITPE